MKKELMLAIFLLVALPTLALADATHQGQHRQGPYFSAFLGVTAPKDADATTDQYPAPIVTFNDRIEFDPGVYIGGTGGYDFGILRLEGELSYKHNEMKTITDRDTGARYRNVDGNVGLVAFMANVFLDLHNDTPVTPYLGGGIGFATIRISDTYGTDNSGTRSLLFVEDDDSVFAYQAGGGLDIALNRRISLDLGYRYFATDTANFNKDWAQATSLKMESHNGMVGVRFKF